jgi:hypothetical protein
MPSSMSCAVSDAVHFMKVGQHPITSVRRLSKTSENSPSLPIEEGIRAQQCLVLHFSCKAPPQMLLGVRVVCEPIR